MKEGLAAIRPLPDMIILPRGTDRPSPEGKGDVDLVDDRISGIHYPEVVGVGRSKQRPYGNDRRYSTAKKAFWIRFTLARPSRPNWTSATSNLHKQSNEPVWER